jgi:hypothetical protein
MLGSVPARAVSTCYASGLVRGSQQRRSQHESNPAISCIVPAHDRTEGNNPWYESSTSGVSSDPIAVGRFRTGRAPRPSRSNLPDREILHALVPRRRQSGGQTRSLGHRRLPRLLLGLLRRPRHWHRCFLRLEIHGLVGPGSREAPGLAAVARQQVGDRFAADQLADPTVLDRHHRRSADHVVVRRHAVVVRTGTGHGQQVAGMQVCR